MPEACLTTIGAAGLDALQPGKFRRIGVRSRSRGLNGRRCPAGNGAAGNRAVLRPCHLPRCFDGDAGKRGGGAGWRLRHCRAAQTAKKFNRQESDGRARNEE
jgi:hypothetical protein